MIFAFLAAMPLKLCGALLSVLYLGGWSIAGSVSLYHCYGASASLCLLVKTDSVGRLRL